MDYTILDFLSLLGAVCLFLYGMKVMSEGLQKVAGDRLRNILGIMTKNRATGVITGILITALIQSSSASTVMVVLRQRRPDVAGTVHGRNLRRKRGHHRNYLDYLGVQL